METAIPTPKKRKARHGQARRYPRESLVSASSFFTEIVAPADEELRHPRIAMFDSCEIRIHPRRGSSPGRPKSQGQGHETPGRRYASRRIGSLPDASWSRRGNDRHRAFTGSCTTVRLDAVSGAPSRFKARRIKARASDIATTSRVHKDNSNGYRRFPVQGLPEKPCR